MHKSLLNSIKIVSKKIYIYIKQVICSHPFIIINFYNEYLINMLPYLSLIETTMFNNHMQAYIYIAFFRLYTTEEGHKSDRKPWSFFNFVFYWIMMSQLRFMFVFYN